MSNQSKKEYALSQAKQTEMLSLSPDDVKLLRHCYNTAVKHKQYKFTFYNKEVVTNYAKYILEYIDGLNKAEENKTK